MSCFNNCYLPLPPRAWSRVQNSCSVITDIGVDGSALIKVPYSNQLVPAAILGQKLAMLNKGNVLQYKANSSNLTKAQKYSKIAQGQWVNRNTTWATQSTRGYTNPNTTSLKRSGNVFNIAIDPITGAIIGQTGAPVTCPKPFTPINEPLPSNGGGGSISEPEIPPPVEPTPASDIFPPIIADTPDEPLVIQDSGTLICSIQENICTGEIKSSLSQQLCNPTTDSDVPGQIELLCWNDGTPTWYPRQRYVMSNSANKWPVNAKLVAAQTSCPVPSPILESVIPDIYSLFASWLVQSNLVNTMEGYIINLISYYSPIQFVITDTQTTTISTDWSMPDETYDIEISSYIVNTIEYHAPINMNQTGSTSVSVTINWDMLLNINEYDVEIEGYIVTIEAI
jgi:hypothetical protein